MMGRGSELSAHGGGGLARGATLSRGHKRGWCCFVYTGDSRRPETALLSAEIGLSGKPS